MLIRITRSAEGIEEYLETGHKKGRELSRDSLDRRVHLSGDINTFSHAVEYTQKYKKWQNHYYHLTASFAYENNDVEDDTLREIAQDMLHYYFCDYNSNSIVFACEAHRPLIQSEINKTTGEVNQRLLHMHLAVSMLDVTTGNQLRMIRYKHEADQSFQSLLAEKYNLVDPAHRKRSIQQTKKDIIGRWNANPDTVHKQTKVAELRKYFAELLDGIDSIASAITLLKSLDSVKQVDYRQQKSGNRYLHVMTTVGTKNINLRGKGFEALEKLYYSADELNLHRQKGQYNDASKKPAKDIVKEHVNWWREQQALRKPKKIDYARLEKKYQDKFDKKSKEARTYYTLYKDTIQEEIICGFRLWEKNNTRYLFNNSLGVKVYDQPNKITAQIPDNALIRSKTITLMLQIALNKGWHLDTLDVQGSTAFKVEVMRQINALQRANTVTLDVRKPSIEHKPEPRLSAVKQAVYAQQQQTALQALSTAEIDDIKNELIASDVLDYAIKHFGVIAEHFSVIDNKIHDDRSKAKPKNVIDFLTKHCNVSITEALPLLNTLLINQHDLDGGCGLRQT